MEALSTLFYRHSWGWLIMGCGTSKQLTNALHELAPRPNVNGNLAPEPDLNQAELEDALRWTAHYISQHSRKSITIIAVGGVVNTISLQSRLSTHDVDWFNSRLPQDDVTLLRKGANYAVQQGSRQGVKYPLDWINNKTSLFIPAQLREELLAEALQQDYEVFSAPGLRVLAAPWGYALMAKLDRMAGGGAKPYDSTDATTYLRQYILHRRVRNVSFETIEQLSRRYRLRLRMQDVQTVSQQY